MDKLQEMNERALVLGGGGVAGIAWTTGLLFGLSEQGVDLRDAELIVGTSAGAAVAAQLGSPLSLGELFQRGRNRRLNANNNRTASVACQAESATFDACANF